MSLRPLFARLGRRLFGGREPEALADDRVELAPAQVLYSAPAIHLPDEADRIVRLADGGPVAAFAGRVAGGEREQPATVAHLFRDALVADGTVYPRRSLWVVSDAPKRPALWGRPDRYDRGLLATNWVCERYFGHWLTDGLSMELLARDMGVAPLRFAREPWTQEPAYRERLGLHATGVSHARVGELWWSDDRAVNGDRRRRMAELRRRNGAGGAGASGPPVFLRRVGGAARRLANQDALADLLVARGFTVLTPEDESVDALRAALRGAPLVVSVEGSALCHAALGLPDGGVVLALQPPLRVDWIQKVWCDCAGLRFAYSVCDPAGDGAFSMPADRLFRVVELALGS